MLQSPAPHEKLDKSAEAENRETLGKFKKLAEALFKVPPEKFYDARLRDEEERRAKRREI